MDTEFSSLITGSRYHTPVCGATHNDALAFQIWIIQLFHRCIEGIHVHVNDHKKHLHYKNELVVVISYKNVINNFLNEI